MHRLITFPLLGGLVLSMLMGVFVVSARQADSFACLRWHSQATVGGVTAHERLIDLSSGATAPDSRYHAPPNALYAPDGQKSLHVWRNRDATYQLRLSPAPNVASIVIQRRMAFSGGLATRPGYAFSPDSRQVALLYTQPLSIYSQATPVQNHIVIADSDGQNLRRGQLTASNVVRRITPEIFLGWSASGRYLAIGTWEGSLSRPTRNWNIYFWDTQTMQQISFPLSSSKPRNQGMFEGVWSPQGDYFAVILESPRRMALISPIIGEVASLPMTDNFARALWAPNGSAIAIEQREGGFQGVLWQDGKVLEAPQGSYKIIGWGRDSTRLGLLERGYSDNYADLKALDLATNTLELVQDDVWIGGEFTVDTSLGLSRILVPYRDSDRHFAVAVMDADGRNAQHIFRGDTDYVRWIWSADRQYAALLNGARIASRLMIVHVPSGAIQEVRGFDQVSNPFWLQDPGHLGYMAQRGKTWYLGMAAAAGGAGREILRIPTNLPTEPPFVASIAPGGRGAILTYSGAYLAAAASRSARVISNAASAFVWSPAGDQVAVWRPDPLGTTVFVQSLEGETLYSVRMPLSAQDYITWSKCD